MMSDILEEPEKDSLLGQRPGAQGLSVMSAKASPANANATANANACRSGLNPPSAER